MTVQLHQLRAVVEVAEQGSFTGAARELMVAQPSVSAAVRAIERELGVELFSRGGTVTPTAAGEALLPWARHALADCEAAAVAVGDLAGLTRGRLVLGATPSLTTDLLAPVLAAFHARHPGVELAVREAGSQRLVTALERGDVDLAVVVLPVERSWVRTEALLEEPLVLAAHPLHRLASRARIEVGDLEGVPLAMFREGYDLRDVALAVCRQAGFQPTFAVEGLEMDGVLACAAAGLGAAVVPASVVRSGGALVAVPFAEAGLRRRIGVAARADRSRSHAARAFEDELRAALSARAT